MGKVTQITDEQINKLIEMYLKNFSKVDIARQLGISTQSVTKYLVKNNIKQKEHFLSDEVNNLICKLYVDENMSIKEISERLNVDVRSVKRALHKNNIKLRTLSESLRQYSLDETYFDNIDTQNKAYILGFLYADGNVGKNKYNIQLSLQEEDKHILEKIKQEIKSDIPLYYKCNTGKQNHKNVYSLIINNKHMHQSLINVGVVPQKTFLIKFPNFLNQNLISHFIRGYFDGDGCFGFYKRKDRKNSYHTVFTLIGTNDFCQIVKQIIEEKLNVHCYIGYCHQKYESPIRCLSISGRINCQKILDWIYKDAEMFLTRKNNKYIEFNKLYNSTY